MDMVTTEMIKEMGLTATAEDDDVMIEVSGDNAKLMELKSILDGKGYVDETEMVALFMGFLVPKLDEVVRILINHVEGIGYCLM